MLIANELESKTKTGLAHATAKASEHAAKLPGESLSSGEVAFFAVDLVVLKGEKCEFRTAFVAIDRFLKISISFVSTVVGGPMIRSTCAFVMPFVNWS